MTPPSLNFARRPFIDERPFFFGAGLGFTLAAIFLVANVRQYAEFHRQIDGTTHQIESLEGRRDRADRDAAASRAALNNYKVSNLASESKALLKLVAERRFSWTALLARLERTLPPDVRVTRLTPRFDENGGAYLDCALIGKTSEAVVRTIVALAHDPLFDAVDLKSEAAPEASLPDGFSFELFLRYRSAPGKTP
jgi:hypothetical protein